MLLENFSIRRVTLHEVYRRADDGSIQQPLRGTRQLALEGDARRAFQSRIIGAFRSDAKCMEMEVLEPFAGSAAEKGLALLRTNDAGFVRDSFEFAELLAQAQTSRSYPGGIVACFDGLVGHPARRYFAVMKAELQEAFLREDDLQATFVDNLFLSPKAKLYKIAIFVENNEDAARLDERFTPYVFDSNLSARNRDGAATYFHSSFLGLEMPENSAFLVRRFFESSKEFIASADLHPEERVDLFNSLYSYLKVERAPTIQIGEFAERFLAGDVEQQYRDFMRDRGVPGRALPRDLSEVEGQLRMRRVRFPRKIQLSGPPEAVADLVTIEDIEGDNGRQWTRITVRGRVEGQE